MTAKLTLLLVLSAQTLLPFSAGVNILGKYYNTTRSLPLTAASTTTASTTDVVTTSTTTALLTDFQGIGSTEVDTTTTSTTTTTTEPTTTEPTTTEPTTTVPTTTETTTTEPTTTEPTTTSSTTTTTTTTTPTSNSTTTGSFSTALQGVDTTDSSEEDGPYSFDTDDSRQFFGHGPFGYKKKFFKKRYPSKISVPNFPDPVPLTFNIPFTGEGDDSVQEFDLDAIGEPLPDRPAVYPGVRTTSVSTTIPPTDAQGIGETDTTVAFTTTEATTTTESPTTTEETTTTEPTTTTEETTTTEPTTTTESPTTTEETTTTEPTTTAEESTTTEEETTTTETTTTTTQATSVATDSLVSEVDTTPVVTTIYPPAPASNLPYIFPQGTFVIAAIAPQTYNRVAGENPQTYNRVVGDNPQTDNRVAGDNPQKYNRVAGDNPQTYNRVAGDNPQTYNRVAGDNPQTYNRVAGDNPQTYNRVAGDNPQTYNRVAGDSAQTYNRTAGDNPQTYNRVAGDSAQTYNRTAGDSAQTYNRVAGNNPQTYNRVTGDAPQNYNRVTGATPPTQSSQLDYCRPRTAGNTTRTNFQPRTDFRFRTERGQEFEASGEANSLSNFVAFYSLDENLASSGFEPSTTVMDFESASQRSQIVVVSQAEINACFLIDVTSCRQDFQFASSLLFNILLNRVAEVPTSRPLTYTVSGVLSLYDFSPDRSNINQFCRSVDRIYSVVPSQGEAAAAGARQVTVLNQSGAVGINIGESFY